MRVYTINERVTRNSIDDISHRGYLMGYAATTGVIIYWNPDQHFFIHIDYCVWCDECNYIISRKDKHTPGYLLLQKYLESLIHNSDHLNLIQFELDITSTPFLDTTILAY